MATETSSNGDELVEKKLNGEEGGADRKSEVASDLDKSQEQKDVTSASSTILAAKYGAPEKPENEPINNEEPEPEPKTELSAETAEKPSEDIESNPPTQANAVKETENSEGAVKVEELEPVTKQMEEKSEDSEKGATDILEEEPINEVDVSTPTPETERTEKPIELVDLEELAKETETSEAESADVIAQVKEFTEAEEQPDKTHVHQSSGKPSSGAVEKDPPEESNAKVLEVMPEEGEKPHPVAVNVEESNPSQEAVAVVGHNSQPEAVLVVDSNDGPEASEMEEKSFEPSEVNEQLEGNKNQEANDNVTAGAAKDEVENSESLKEENTSVVKTAEKGHSDVKVGVEVEHKATVGSMHIEENGEKSATAEVAKEERSLKEENEIPVAYSEDGHVGIKLEVSEAFEAEPVEQKLEVKEEPTANGEARDLKKGEAEELVNTDIQNTMTPLSMKELTANEPVQEKQLQSDQLHVEEAVRKDDVNLGEKQENTVKTVHKPEQPTEDSDKSNRASEEIQEVPTKPKQANNILSKMKQSLVKAKKAIIGKNPGSKAVSTEVK